MVTHYVKLEDVRKAISDVNEIFKKNEEEVWSQWDGPCCDLPTELRLKSRYAHGGMDSLGILLAQLSDWDDYEEEE